MLDDLRDSLGDDYLADEPDEETYAINFDEIEAQQVAAKPQRGFLGMTAGERAFLAVMLFFIVLIFGVAILVVTNRIG